MYSNSPTSKGQPISSENVVVQPALSIGAVNDPLEKEADLMADKVMRMPERGLIQRKCTDCEEEDKVQRKPLASFIQKKGAQGGMVASDSVSNRINSSRGKGKRLSKSTKSFMENRFDTDFSNVNIHTGSEATNMSRDLGAKAFTVGNDIYFNKGQYSPSTSEGKRLLAHELTHSVQQGGVILRQAAVQPKIRRFSHHRVSVIIRASCDADAFRLDTVETAFRSALDKIFEDDCIEITRRKAIQNNLKKHGYDVRCLDSAMLKTPGACAEATGFFIPANIMTLGSKAFGGGACGDLASTILHEIIHVTRGRFEEDVSTSCEASCFGFGSADPDLCKNTDVFGKRHV